MVNPEDITLEEVEKLYKFLQGEVPDSLTLRETPNLTANQAFAVIYYLQEIMGILPDKYEQCQIPGCGELFDSAEEGCLAMYCECCGCQHPDGYDPYETGCDDCPVVLGTEQKCRVCGCTWFTPCEGGCFWVEDDLCSKCTELK